MNGPIKMYQTKQIVQHDFPVELPKCMYRMKNIHARRNGMVDGPNDHVTSSEVKLEIFEQVKQFLKNNQQIPGMAELQAKQADILKQLAELKKQIDSIKSDLNIKHSTPVAKPIYSGSSAATQKAHCSNDLSDIVINASPTNPPYSLEIIQKLFKDVVNFNVTIQSHSSVGVLSDNAKELERRLVSFKPVTGTPSVNVTLIWKTVGVDTELLVGFLPIRGEVNLLRYLSRAIQSPLTYSSDPNSIEIDSLLDICYLIVRSKTKVERAALYQSLNKSLGKAQWLTGRSQVGIADIAAYSSIKQVSGESDISAALKKWYQRCELVA
nr:unnamed protein product [Callosobruchus chinensis]